MALKKVTVSLNGQTYTLEKNADTGKHEATITAPTKSSYGQTGHKYAMALKAEDQAGNITTIDQKHATFGEKMKLDVNEKVPPVIVVSKPGAGAFLTNQTVQIQFDITDNDSGVNPDSISLQIDSLAAVTADLVKEEITNGYRCTYSATLKDGSHTIKINAKDYDDNMATQKTVGFKVDTVPPMLNISTPAQGLVTNKQSCIVTGITNDATSGPVTVVVRLNAVDQGAVTVGGDGSFSKTVTLKTGENTIYVKTTDKAGKYYEVTRKVTYDPDEPIVHTIEITPNPVDAGKTFKIVVDVTD